MTDEVFCTRCKRELTGLLQVVTTVIDMRAFIIYRETPDCNWRLCRECGRIVCKACSDSRRYHCCEEAVAPERTAVNLASAETGRRIST
jgi:hypothetical protein